MEQENAPAGQGLAITPRVVVGLFVLCMGVLLLLDHMGQLRFSDYARWWPVFVIAFGIVRLAQPCCRLSGLVFLGIGGWALLHTLGYADFDLDYIWPVLLVLLGASLVWRGFRGPRLRRPAGGAAADNDAHVSAFAMLGSVARRVSAQAFRGGDATAILGGCDIDLRGSSPAPEGAVLETFALWGGVDVKVPPDWTVVLQGSALLGGFDSSRTDARPDPAKRLIVRGMAVMGGVEVKG